MKEYSVPSKSLAPRGRQVGNITAFVALEHRIHAYKCK